MNNTFLFKNTICYNILFIIEFLAFYVHSNTTYFKFFKKIKEKSIKNLFQSKQKFVKHNFL